VVHAIRKKIVVDERGKPREVIIPWSQFREMIEALGLDLDEKAKADLRAARRDLNLRKTKAFKPLSAL
jgi:PHD/YefM family antitoxin component YafN of YafNO toxin-antitoxin module